MLQQLCMAGRTSRGLCCDVADICVSVQEAGQSRAVAAFWRVETG